ncbi:hypothetical protein U1Q18_027635 [Sarracenia purpurea var. burkii]
MAFFSKAGNILRQTLSKHMNSEIYGSNPSVFQMIRSMSSSKVFVGGLSYSTDDTSLREAFNKYGDVIEARVIIDRESGRSRGFGFVTYANGEEASAAIQALDGQDIHGRRVRVNYANERPPRVGGFGGGGYGGGGYGGGGGGGYGGGYGGNFGGGGGYGGGDNYGSGGGNYGYGSGGSGDSYAQGGTYASGTNYDSQSGGGNYGGGSQSFNIAGGNSSAQGVPYASGGNYDAGSSGSGSQSFSVSGGGGGGSDDYVSGDAPAKRSFASGGFDGSTGLGHDEDEFGSSNEILSGRDDADGFGKGADGFGKGADDENYEEADEDEPDDDFANKRG